jgi:hypothetical protein
MHRCYENIKTYIKELELQGVDLVHLTQDGIQCKSLVNTAMIFADRQMGKFLNRWETIILSYRTVLDSVKKQSGQCYKIWVFEGQLTT